MPFPDHIICEHLYLFSACVTNQVPPKKCKFPFAYRAATDAWMIYHKCTKRYHGAQDWQNWWCATKTLEGEGCMQKHLLCEIANFSLKSKINIFILLSDDQAWANWRRKQNEEEYHKEKIRYVEYADCAAVDPTDLTKACPGKYSLLTLTGRWQDSRYSY